MFCTAEPASGSVMPMLISASPSAAAGSQRSFMASGPRCSIPRGGPLKVSWQQMADETSARAISSSTMDASTSPRPMPPHCSPIVMRRRSAVARALRTSGGTSPVSSPCDARGATSRRATSRASWRSAAWSSVSARRSTPASATHPLCAAHQSPSSLPTMPTKLTPSPGAPPRLWVRPERAARAHGGDLALGRRLAAQLQPALEEHAQPGGADGVAEALEPPVGVDRQLAVAVEGAGQHLFPCRAPGGEAQVLHEDQLGRGEAVVHLGHGQLGPGIGDPGLRGRRPRPSGPPRGRWCSRSRGRWARRPARPRSSGPSRRAGWRSSGGRPRPGR